MELEHKIVKNIYKFRKNRNGTEILNKKKIGVLVAGVKPEWPENFVVGFSLCCKNDKWNVVQNKDGTSSRIENFGLNLATKRAIVWQADTRDVEVPDSIKSELEDFVTRCQRYYKDRSMPIWVIGLMSEQQQDELQTDAGC